jgi:hypothetical protein
MNKELALRQSFLKELQCRVNNQTVDESRMKKRHSLTYTVEIITDDACGVVVSELWKRDGLMDRADGPALIARDAATGIIVEEIWCRSGNPDRRDGPAVTRRKAATGEVTYKAWYSNGKRTSERHFRPRSAPRAQQKAASLTFP